jgi:hypothetical protein
LTSLSGRRTLHYNGIFLCSVFADFRFWRRIYSANNSTSGLEGVFRRKLKPEKERFKSFLMIVFWRVEIREDGFLSLFLSLFHSLCLSICLSLYLSLTLSLLLFLSFSLSFYSILSIFLSSLSLSLSLSLSIPLSFSFLFSLFYFLSLFFALPVFEPDPIKYFSKNIFFNKLGCFKKIPHFHSY